MKEFPMLRLLGVAVWSYLLQFWALGAGKLQTDQIYRHVWYTETLYFQENIQIKLEVNPMKYNFQQIPRLTVSAAVTALANIQLPSPCIDVVCFPGKRLMQDSTRLVYYFTHSR